MTRSQYSYESDFPTDLEDLSHRFNSQLFQREFRRENGPGRGSLVEDRKWVQPSEFRPKLIDLQFLGPGQSCSNHSPIFAQVFDSFEARDELQGHITLFIPLDVLQEERVLDDVLIGEVELDLSANFVREFFTRRQEIFAL